MARKEQGMQCSAATTADASPPPRATRQKIEDRSFYLNTPTA